MFIVKDSAIFLVDMEEIKRKIIFLFFLGNYFYNPIKIKQTIYFILTLLYNFFKNKRL